MWVPSSDFDVDLVEEGKKYEIPVQSARAKYLGPYNHAAIDSLAAKLWMIENAEHTIDFTYYIFKPDLVGLALVGAMCNAVRRGVDIRIVIDSAGSISGLTHPSLKALETCEEDAGFMRNATGQLTTKRARIQVVVFNAITTVSSPNRRSHDKLLIKDGSFERKSAVLSGGRNISLDYYGITKDGEQDEDPFRDAELLIRSSIESVEQDKTVGELSEGYNTLLFLLPFNRRIQPGRSEGEAQLYWQKLRDAEEALAKLKAFDYFKPHMAEMDEFMSSDFHDTRVLLAHELGNLTDRSVTRNALKNQGDNPNSILSVLEQIGDQDPDIKTIRIVSPYLFLAEYRDAEGNIIEDEARSFLEWIKSHPDTRLEIVTNSILTSDNFPAQSVIDMDTAPRLLLPPDVHQQWLATRSVEELESELVNSDRWRELVQHPQIYIYETGQLDSVLLGGEKNYGKLHAKIFMSEDVGFVGTTNFDYRSRLYNNEFGFFFNSPALIDDVNQSIDDLISISYRWGSPEWLRLRNEVIKAGGIKGTSSKGQRSWYKLFKSTGLIWWL